MANIQERRDKSGKLISYSIRVHRGRGLDGKQLAHMDGKKRKKKGRGFRRDL